MLRPGLCPLLRQNLMGLQWFRERRAVDCRLPFVLCCALALAGCRGGPSSTGNPRTSEPGSKDAIRQITVHTATGWLLTIKADGSGSVGYGSSAQDFAPFPQGTFRFAEVRDRLLPQSRPAGSIREGFAVTFAREGEISSTARYVSDSKMVEALFEKAVASAQKTGTRVEELYAAHPPVALRTTQPPNH